ncbi:MAG TPA: hypothetical protein VK402_11265 [Blastococcus sp.]|nr:hypothetical protein [Blastococcus sp.]
MSLPTNRGFVAAALIFFVAVSVANAARGDWISVVLGLLIAVLCGRRLWVLRPGGAQL